MYLGQDGNPCEIVNRSSYVESTLKTVNYFSVCLFDWLQAEVEGNPFKVVFLACMSIVGEYPIAFIIAVWLNVGEEQISIQLRGKYDGETAGDEGAAKTRRSLYFWLYRRGNHAHF